MDQQKIGKFIHNLRTERNLTQKQLADKINVSTTTVSKWESGTNVPDYSNISILADFFQISISELLEGERTEISKLSEYEVDLSELKSVKRKKVLLLIIVLFLLVCILIVGIWYINYAPPRFRVVDSYIDEPEKMYSEYNFEKILRVIVDYNGKISDNDLYNHSTLLTQEFSEEAESVDAIFIEYYEKYSDTASYDYFSIRILPPVD